MTHAVKAEQLEQRPKMAWRRRTASVLTAVPRAIGKCAPSRRRSTLTPAVFNHTLPDGRQLAFDVRGGLNRSNVVMWGHGTLSCRLEVRTHSPGTQHLY
jgi:hypothetical protein